VKPAYPPLARRFNREGRVLLRLTVAETGALVKVEVLEDPGFGLATAAMEAVRKSRFNPARRAGKPFAAKALLPVRFTLGGGE
jgi:protein TonB